MKSNYIKDIVKKVKTLLNNEWIDLNESPADIIL